MCVMKKKRSWDVIRNLKATDTTKYRDVYDDQQLERGELAKTQTMFTRNILNICLSVVVFAVMWFGVSAAEMVFGGDEGIEQSLDPRYTWIYVNEYYVNVSDESDKLTVAEFDELMAEYNPNIPVVEEPVKPPETNPQKKYVKDSGGYVIEDIVDSWISVEEWEAMGEQWEEDVAIYELRLAEYKKYLEESANPKDTYKKLVAHYRNRHDLSQYITVDAYNELIAEYEKDVEAGKYSEEDLSIPGQPIDPSIIYKVFERGDVPRTDTAGNIIYDEEGNMAVVKNQPITYESKLDGTKISAYDYDEYVNKYNQDIVVFKEIYLKHREQYHPENVDGTAMIFDLSFNATKFVICLCVAIFCFALLYWVLSKNLKAQNLMADTSDINMYHNDQHIALPEEIQRNYDWFPDVGAHSGVQVSSMISHMALTNKGLKTVQLAKRADKDIKDKDGNIEYYKGAIIEDDDGNPVTSTVPMIDEEFMEALYDASGAPKDKDVRKKYDTTKIPYNPDGSNRDKLGKYDTVADLINEDWEFPLYEPQRPGGAYIVDTAPVNTMVLAITRAGKGQTVIEPTLDMWMREKRPNNMVVNDPKGELLVKNYVRATVRGLQVVQFNLINAMKTDIYNPLALAADAAREGDNTKCAMYVENIADVFFPLDGGEDPLWPNAANNAFKRAAYGLIDFYLEEEKAMRRMAERTHLNEKVLEQRLDEMWGKVTLYNCYQLFVQLSSKKMKNPAVEFSNQAKAGKFNDLSDAEYQAELEKVKNKSKLWEDKPEADLLTLYFSATDMLPRNSMRTLVANANNALKAIGGAEKMLSSVYGIAITAMSFFTDPTISTLTSGTPNQNVDLGGMSFPRRMGVRFNSDYINKYHFVGQQAVWNAYEDIDFKNCLGKDFYHEDMVTREGWARYYFDGKFKNDIAYVKLEIKNPSNGSLIRTFYFEFKKNYQTSLDGRVYMKDPVLEEKIVKNGLLTELRKFKKKDGSIVFKKSKTTFKQQKILDFKNAEKIDVNVNAIISTMCRYSEKPKMVFLVTPPHLILGNLDKCQEICYN